MLMLLGVLTTLPMMARDFEYTYEGQTLTYTVISEDDKTCMTKAGEWPNAGNIVTGSLVIPAMAIDGDSEYSVVTIGDYAFCRCEGLSSVTIPRSVISIGDMAFSSCDNLADVAIPQSVAVIGDAPFRFDQSLKKIDVEEGNQNFCSVEGVLFDINKTKLIQFPSGWIGEYSVPNTVTTIGYGAFGGCENLISVTIPNSVVSIGEGAFAVCSNLVSVTISDSVTEIGNSAFTSCENLLSITIPNSVTTIGDHTFSSCSSLLSVSIPESVVKIGGSAFSRCRSLTSVYIPNSVVEIGRFAFGNCSGLTTVVIPEFVSTIGDYAFSECIGLLSVTIPGSIMNIGYSAFGHCSSLVSVYYASEDPIEADYYTFDSSVYENSTLYVPAAAIEKCRPINPWKNFKNIEAYEFSGIEYVATDDLPCEVYTVSGLKVADSTYGLSPGIYIVRQGNDVKKIAVN